MSLDEVNEALYTLLPGEALPENIDALRVGFDFIQNGKHAASRTGT